MFGVSPDAQQAPAREGHGVEKKGVTPMAVESHPLPRAVPEVARHLAWLAVVCTVAFVMPYVGVSVLDLQHDVFYLAYFAVTIALVATYVRVKEVDVAAIFRNNWRWSVGAGVGMAGFLVVNVFSTSDATARPHGAYFLFEVA